MAPALAASLHRHLAAVDHLTADPPGLPVVAHGDFGPSQVLFDGPTTSLVDLDTVCIAEPALDLAQFTGQLAVADRRARDAGAARDGGLDGGQDLTSAFLREYLRLSDSDPDTFVARVAAYRTVELARLAVRSWCRLRPERLRPTLALLDEPSALRAPERTRRHHRID
jgi:aminoglycoside phosphotransferase (APT) family kinase protein